MNADNFSQVAQAINEHRYPRSVRRRIRDDGFWSRTNYRWRKTKPGLPTDLDRKTPRTARRSGPSSGRSARGPVAPCASKPGLA